MFVHSVSGSMFWWSEPLAPPPRAAEESPPRAESPASSREPRSEGPPFRWNGAGPSFAARPL